MDGSGIGLLLAFAAGLLLGAGLAGGLVYALLAARQWQEAAARTGRATPLFGT